MFLHRLRSPRTTTPSDRVELQKSVKQITEEHITEAPAKLRGKHPRFRALPPTAPRQQVGFAACPLLVTLSSWHRKPFGEYRLDRLSGVPPQKSDELCRQRQGTYAHSAIQTGGGGIVGDVSITTQSPRHHSGRPRASVGTRGDPDGGWRVPNLKHDTKHDTVGGGEKSCAVQMAAGARLHKLIS